MSRVLKQSKTMTGYTSSSYWTWKQVVEEYFEEDSSNQDYYLSSNKSFLIVKSYIGVASNTSSSGSFGGTAKTNITCDGDSRDKTQSWNYQSFWINPGGWKLIQEESFYIKHENDGTKKINVSSSLSTTQFNPNNTNASGDMVLTYIPRTTEFPQDSYNITIEGNLTIPIKSASTSFTHSLKLSIGSDYVKYINPETAELLDDEYKFSSQQQDIDILMYAPSDWYSLFASSDTTGNLLLTTYNNDKSIGTSSSNLNISCDEALCSPVVMSATVYDTNNTTYALTKDRERMVSGYSNCKTTFTIRISDEDDKNTTLASLIVNGESIDVSKREYIINNISSNIIVVEMENSRGFKNSNAIQINKWVPYVPVGIPEEEESFGGSAIFIRAFQSSSTGTTIQNAYCSFSSMFYDGYFADYNINKNTFTFKWRYKEQSSDTYSEWYTLDTSECERKNNWIDTFNLSTPLYLKDNDGNLIEFEYHTTYSIEYEYKDSLSSYKRTTILYSSTTVFSWSQYDFKVTDSFKLGGINSLGESNIYGVPTVTDSEKTYDNISDETSGYYPRRIIAKGLTSSEYFNHNSSYDDFTKEQRGFLSLNATTLTAKQKNEWITPTCWADIIYPVGSIYMSITDTNPELLFGGTWEQIKDTFLLSAGDKYTAGTTGGEEKHILTVSEMPSHSHTIGMDKDAVYNSSGGSWSVHDAGTSGSQSTTKTGSSGSGTAHNNMPPYLTVYMWKRVS